MQYFCFSSVRNGLGLLLLLLISEGVLPLLGQTPGPDVTGQWAPVMQWPSTPMHAHVLPTGKVMYWPNSDRPRLWDPATPSTSPVAVTTAGVNIFCSGHSFLPDGRMLVTGGHVTTRVGLPDTHVYNAFDGTWTRFPDMNAARWYPSNVTLGNGDVLVVSGQIDTTQGMNPLPQVWQTALESWRSLTTAELILPFYPYIYQAPNGAAFLAGPQRQTRFLNTSGTGSWTNGPLSNYGARNWGSSVMYAPGKILLAGGSTCVFYGGCSTLPTATAEIIDLNSPTPTWTYTGSMQSGRKHHNLIVLPDGKVLASGGTRGMEPTTQPSQDPAYAAEMWDPATGTWSTMASFTNYRGYHSVALLLPDGKVLSAGGDFGGPTQVKGTGNYAEIYSPPYLFKGPRPTITSGPSNVGYGATFSVSTPDASKIARVTWIALPSVTHGVNYTQRMNELQFSAGVNSLNVTAPVDPNSCPPGYYMLFILDSNGVPSIAHMVRISAGEPATPAAPSGLTAVPVTDRVTLTWLDNSSNETGFTIERSAAGGTFTQIGSTAANVLTYTDTGLAPGSYSYRVRASNEIGNSTFSNVASATVVQQLTPPSNLNAAPISSSQIRLGWTDTTTSETGFQILRSTAPASGFAQIAVTAANATTYLDSGLPAATTYYYKVLATDGVNRSSDSNVASATTSSALVSPAAPTNLSAQIHRSGRVILSWTDNASNEAGFRVERSTDGVTWTVIASTAANQAQYTDASTKKRNTYHYRVHAYNTSGSSAYSNTVTARP